MTQPLHPASTIPPEFTEPEMLRIPEGWFLVGSDPSQPGQDNERPAHRVWIDAFELAACQVTNADYAKFLAAPGRDKVQRKPLQWDDPNFSHPEQPVVAPSWFDAVAYCEWLSRSRTSATACPPKPNGNPPRAAAPSKALPLGRRPTRIARKLRVALEDSPERAATPRTTPTASSTSAQTSTNGAPTGSTPITTASRPIAIHRAQPKVPANPPAAAPGAIRQKYPLRRPRQHPPRIPVRRLRLPRRPRFSGLTVSRF